MYVQNSEIVGGQVVPKEGGRLVRLIEQTADHRVLVTAGGEKVDEFPASEFFQTHREATRDEIDAHEKRHAPNGDDSAAELKAALSEAKTATKAAEAATKTAEAATAAAEKVTAKANAAIEKAEAATKAADEAAKKAAAPPK